MMALNQGLVPEDRRDAVRRYMRAHAGELMSPYSHLFLFEELYKMNSQETDTEVLQIIRNRWATMIARKDPGTLAEQFLNCTYVCHDFGTIPASFLSEYVLGIRMDGPVWNKRIIIEPRLGDLNEAEGVVVTRHGPVPDAWKRATDGRLDFESTVPDGETADLSIPRPSATPTLTIDGKVIGEATARGRFLSVELRSGKHTGSIKP